MARKERARKKPSLRQPCIFCGEDATRKSHAAFCTGIPRAAEPPSVPVPEPPSVIQDEPYENQGKGLVLTNDSITSHVARLFLAKPFRESQELNELVGWQFSQAVFALRRRGWRIQTLRLAPRRFAYQLLVAAHERQAL